MRYSFENLTWLDFEELVRDLLQAELGLPLEGFKPGPDEGIDFRFSRALGQNDVVVQCKHYQGMGAAQLVREVTNGELPKVKRLKPKRYILAVSAALPKAQKEKLCSNFAPSCRRTADIFDGVALNALLEKHVVVHDAHYKLWLPSVSVLQRVLNQEVFERTRSLIEEIEERRPFLVETPTFAQAKVLLDEHGFCLVAGIPGIGKTTLARMLALAYMSYGWELVEVSGDISEASAVSVPGKKQFFYYDDFLGQASDLDKLAKNEDSRLLQFVRDLRRHRDSKKLVLTTREYVLNQARDRYENLGRIGFDASTCTLLLEGLSVRDRAHMLFNYLARAGLSSEHLSELLSKRRVLEIVRHRNFSPRTVEAMTVLLDSTQTKVEDYADVFIGNLEHPRELWRSAFEQLSFSTQQLLVVLATLPERSSLENVGRAFHALHQYEAARFRQEMHPDDFDRALRQAVGTFISTDRLGRQDVVFFQNPSIRDFLISLLSHAEHWWAEVLESAVFLHQPLRLVSMRLFGLENLNTEFKPVEAEEFAVAASAVIKTKGSYILKGLTPSDVAYALLQASGTVGHDSDALVDALLAQVPSDIGMQEITAATAFRLIRVLLGSGWATSAAVPLLKSFLLQIADDVDRVENYDRVEHWNELRLLFQRWPELLSESERESLGEYIEQDGWRVAYDDVYEVASQNPGQWGLLDVAAEHFDALAQWLGVDLGSTSEWLRDEAAEHEEAEKEVTKTVRAPVRVQDVPDEELLSMFSMLAPNDNGEGAAPSD